MSFAGAPVSKALIVIIGSATLLAAASSRQHYFSVPLSPHLTRDHQLWRLFAHHAVFGNSSELFLGMLLLFYTSISVERSFGSRKFASYLVVTTAFSTFLELVVLLLGSKLGFTKIPAGPFALTFALVYQSARLIPSTFYWKIFGLELPNRIALYVLAAQLFASQPPISIAPSLIGVLSSYLYRADFLHMRSYRLSPRLVLLISRFVSPIIGATATPHRGSFVNFGDGIQSISVGFPGALGPVTAARSTTPATPAVGQQRTAAASPAPGGLVQQWAEGMGGQRQPTAQQITELSSIFPDQSREAVVAALQRSQMDVSRAAEVLLASAS